MEAPERGPLRSVTVSAFRIPTEEPESDGTLEWDSTTLVTVELVAVGEDGDGGVVHGLGYGYAHRASAVLIADLLAPALIGSEPSLPAARRTMLREVRNLGRQGLAAMAVSTVDAALWDLYAKRLGVPLVDLLGPVRDEVPAYGSGGFTSYSTRRLCEQLAGWVENGIPRVKMKVGRDPAADPDRVAAARDAIGVEAELMVDANGAYDRKQALAMASTFADSGVSWFEEPVSSDDLEGLRLVRDRAPAGIEVAAGEYGWDLFDLGRMLDAGAVDVLMADATRCGGVSGFLDAAALCRAEPLPLSSHCAPTLHAHPACAAAPVRHVEHFHDHARIEAMAFDGALSAHGGALRPDRSRPGLGLELKAADLEPYRVFREEVRDG